MTFKEFWAAYHREDPNEALEHPHRLIICLKSGKKHKAYFPGSLLATSRFLSVGTHFKRDGTHRDSEFVPWDEIDRIEFFVESRSSQQSRRGAMGAK